jgi:flagellar basal body-associated protein FliL
MIIVFLFILIVALVIANILIGAAYPKKNSEKGFVEPFENEEAIHPEVVNNINDIKENTMIIQGSLQATNKKVEMLNERLATLEKVVITMVENKISDKN